MSFRGIVRVLGPRFYSRVAAAESSLPGVDLHSSKSALELALSVRDTTINSWTRDQIREIYHSPLLSLIHQAQIQTGRFHDPREVQICNLLSIKTGGCTEDCKYCSQSSRNNTGLEATKLMSVGSVLEKAREAKANGATRFCMGAAWRDMTGRKSGLSKIGEMVKGVNDLGMESCVTLGMINEEQAQYLKDAGLTAYNHNIDTSREHYPNVISTRTYDDRLKTIGNVNKSGLKVCTGGILGLGETEEDHIGFLHTLSNLEKHPESLPINRLVAIDGTPIVEDLKKAKKLSMESVLRTIATARLLMPKSIIRLAAGRYSMKESEQALSFMAGCNAIFSGERMLTTMCNGWDEDKSLLERWGLKPMRSFEKTPCSSK